jgi:hypothetical protein
MIDPQMAGRELGTVTFPVERSKLMELARAFHDDDPLWHDTAPPTVTVLADHWREHGALSAAIALGADLERLLHGEAAWEYLVPVRPGDTLTATSRVGEITTREGKRGGAMTLVAIETDFVNQHGELAVRRRDTLIERGA